MELTLKINTRTKAGKVFIDFIENFIENNSAIEIVGNREKIFLKELNKSASQAKEIVAGRRKGKSVKELMNEL